MYLLQDLFEAYYSYCKNKSGKYSALKFEIDYRKAYVMKLDITDFFMNINHDILYYKFETFLKDKYCGNDLDIVLYLIKQVVYNDYKKKLYF